MKKHKPLISPITQIKKLKKNYVAYNYLIDKILALSILIISLIKLLERLAYYNTVLIYPDLKMHMFRKRNKKSLLKHNGG